MVRNWWNRTKRYTRFYLEHIAERCRGLDFTMRDLSQINESNHGYSKTVDEHVYEILDQFEIGKDDYFIDIGCGKGAVLRCASKYSFGKIYGIDIGTNLIETANKNFRVLNLDERILCEVMNATAFDGYDHYNYFFFFNPFSHEVFERVFRYMEESLRNKPRKCIIIYHNPVCRNLIEQSQYFVLEKVMYEKWKNYETRIYTSVLK